jgi:6-phosphogluconate dehydrogenase
MTGSYPGTVEVMTPDSDTHFGLTGLATMGANLARNVAHHDVPVVVHNRTTSRMTAFLEQHDSEGPISGAESVKDWVGALARPRVLMSMVQAGPATDAVIDEITPHLDAGDVLIDGGNANFRDTQRRHAALAQHDIHFLGVGVSGGEEGALKGPSIMPGGDRAPYDDSVKAIFEAIAADVDGTPCVTYVGADGAGHFVKMVHNAGQKGTGRWTAQNALELGVPLTGITEAVFARGLSSLVDERGHAAGVLRGPDADAPRSGDEQLAHDLEHALYASKIVSYAQGFAQMAAAADDEGWDIDLGSMATIWRGGCIIRARFLDRIREAYDDEPGLKNLMLADFFAQALEQAQDPWRRVVARSAELGIPTPAFSSSLAYYDGYRRARGPASLIQGLRDLFGAHTYARTDRDGAFHTLWSGDGSEVQG